MVDRYIICVLAHEAEKNNDQYEPKYVDIGKNSKCRIDGAIDWYERVVVSPKVTWAFGAGTDSHHKLGPTLASFQRQYLRQKLPNADVICNVDKWKYYGTLEEIDWVIEDAKQRYPGEKLMFIFCTQAVHIERVIQIRNEFYPSELFFPVTTGHLPGYHIKWWQEIVSYIKLKQILKGKAKRRWEI